MNELRQTAELLQRLTTGKHRFSTKKGEKPTGDALFFSGLLDGSIRTDRDAARLLFGSEENTVAYRSAKSRLYKRLEKELLTVKIDRKKDGEYQWALVECMRMSLIIKMLSSYGKSIAALAYCNYTLTIATEYQLTNIQYEMLRLLQLDAEARGNRKDFESLTTRRKEVARRAAAEVEIEEEYLRIMTITARNSAPDNTDINRAFQALRSLEERFAKEESYSYRAALFRLKVQVYSITGDHAASVESCNEFDRFYDKYPKFSTALRRGEVSHRRVAEYILMRKRDEAKAESKVLKALLPEGTPNWCYCMINYIELCLQMLEFAEAAEAVTQLEKYVKKRDTLLMFKEQVKLYKGYLWYAHQSGWAFKLGADLGQYPFVRRAPSVTKADFTFSQKDKQGANFAFIVLLFLKHLHADTLHKMSENSLKKYEQRYRKDKPTRAFTFSKILQAVLSKQASVEQIIAVCTPLLSKLSELPRTLDSAEILQFEPLWEHIIQRKILHIEHQQALEEAEAARLAAQEAEQAEGELKVEVGEQK
ncbi:MAG: hypothetical protein IPM69_00265 [Ignavibacteria bacterium]|nr:hypothetical protein [Ignavibacteria bacterium]